MERPAMSINKIENAFFIVWFLALYKVN
jgi:hypothetical protein